MLRNPASSLSIAAMFFTGCYISYATGEIIADLLGNLTSPRPQYYTKLSYTHYPNFSNIS